MALRLAGKNQRNPNPMDKSEFANLVERLIDLKMDQRTMALNMSNHEIGNSPEYKQNKQQIQLTKDRIQEMVDSR